MNNDKQPPTNVEGPEHLCPKPAPGLVFDSRGVLVPAATAPLPETGLMGKPHTALMREHADYMASYNEPFVGSTDAIARALRTGADRIDQLERELAERTALLLKTQGDLIERNHELFVARSARTERLWLWKNFVDGCPEYWAFDNAYPTHGGGDPMTLGEPCGYAIFKPSTKAPGHDESDEQVIEAVKRAAARSTTQPSEPVTQDGPLGGWSPVGEAASELDLKLTLFQAELEAIAELDPHNSAEQDDYNHHFDQASAIRREIVEKYTPRSAIGTRS